MSDFRVDISAVVPVGLRRDDLGALLDEYAQGLREANVSFEVIAVIDGPLGGMVDVLTLLADRPWLRVVELAKNFGESAALTAGFDVARGRKLLTLPAYYQVVPSELGKLIGEGAETDMAIAVRWPRAGSAVEGVRRNAFHSLLRVVTGHRYRDLGCGVRLLTREVVDEIPLYSDRHRFYPVLAMNRGFEVREIEMRQSPKDKFQGKYQIRVYLYRLLDIATVFFLTRFIKKPLRFFGMAGFLLAALGAMILAILAVQRLFLGVALADRPLLLGGSLIVVLGVQIFALGLIGELIIFTHAGDLKEYAVRRVISRSSAVEADETDAPPVPAGPTEGMASP